MHIVADDPEQRNPGGPHPHVTLGDQLVTDAQAQPWHVGVGLEAVEAAARVVANLEHCVDPVLVEVVHVPRLRRAPGGSDSGETFTVFLPWLSRITKL